MLSAAKVRPSDVHKTVPSAHVSLERQLLQQLDLGHSPSYYDNYHNLNELRHQILNKLPLVLLLAHLEGQAIALPDESLCLLVTYIAQREVSTSLRHTWQSVSALLRAHIAAADLTEPQQRAIFLATHRQLLQHFVH